MQIEDAERIIISMSLFVTFMFEFFYSDSLLSCLVAKEFEKPIDTIEDLLHSGLTMYYPGKTAIGKYLETHTNMEMEQIRKSQAESVPFRGNIPSFATDR